MKKEITKSVLVSTLSCAVLLSSSLFINAEGETTTTNNEVTTTTTETTTSNVETTTKEETTTTTESTSSNETTTKENETTTQPEETTTTEKPTTPVAPPVVKPEAPSVNGVSVGDKNVFVTVPKNADTIQVDFPQKNTRLFYLEKDKWVDITGKEVPFSGSTLTVAIPVTLAKGDVITVSSSYRGVASDSATVEVKGDGTAEPTTTTTKATEPTTTEEETTEVKGVILNVSVLTQPTLPEYTGTVPSNTTSVEETTSSTSTSISSQTTTTTKSNNAVVAPKNNNNNRQFPKTGENDSASLAGGITALLASIAFLVKRKLAHIE